MKKLLLFKSEGKIFESLSGLLSSAYREIELQIINPNEDIQYAKDEVLAIFAPDFDTEFLVDVCKKYPFWSIIGVASEVEDLKDLAQYKNLNIILGIDQDNHVRSNEIEYSINKLTSKNIFGLKQHLPNAITFTSREINHPLDRHTAIDEIVKDVKDRNVGLRKLKNLEICLNETINNAFYHADPAFEKSHDISGEIKATHSVLVEWGFNDQFFGFSVNDFFGRLDRDIYFKYLFARLNKKEIEKKDPNSTLGLGIYMSFKTLHNMIVNLAKDERTEVIGLIRTDMNRKELVNHYHRKSFLFFQS